MSDITITIPCPNEECEESLSVECEYQGAEPDIGIMNGGPTPSDDIPTECKACGTTFSADQIAVLRKAVVEACEDWRPDDDDGPDYDPMDVGDLIDIRDRDWI